MTSPALTMRSAGYPPQWGNRVPKRVRLTADVQPVIGELIQKKTPKGQRGQEVEVYVNSHGAVAAIIDGSLLGLMPQEFEVIEWHDGGRE